MVASRAAADKQYEEAHQPIHGSLAEALVGFLSEVPKVGKSHTATVPTKSGGSYSYKYADLVDVTDTAYPILVRHGLAFTATARRVEDGSYELVGILRHVSGERDEGSLPLFGRTPQELGSSITYDRRYLLGMMTGLVTDEDTDAAGAAHEPTRVQGPPPPPPSPELLLGAARGRAWGAFRFVHGAEATKESMAAAYEQWKAQPFADATVEDFDQFAAYVEKQAQEGTTP